ncbi:MAG: glycosyltransferase family 4 protein [Crocinitomicaceae bacterium]
MTNLVYIISSISKSVAFEWICEELDKSKYKLTFILLNETETPIENYLIKNNITCYRVKYVTKKDLLFAIFKIRSILKKEKTDIVHAHLFEGSFIGLIAAKLAGVKRRIHTRHNATIHHNYFPHAVKYDKFINYLSTDIIAISDNVKSIIINKEGVSENKISIIHHGFKLNEFSNVERKRVEEIRRKHLPNTEGKIIFGVISRYIHWKGIQFIIPAFNKFVASNSNAHLVICNATGPYQKEIQLLLNELPKDSYSEIKFEEDVFALYQNFNFFIHTPIDEESEAFGQVYVEALASSIPSIVTLSGIAPEFMAHKKNAWIVSFCNSEEIYQGMLELSSNQNLIQEITAQGLIDVHQLFPLNQMISSLEKLYERSN